jgi:hypothetical protein
LAKTRSEGEVFYLRVGPAQLLQHEVEGVGHGPDFILVFDIHLLAQVVGADDVFHGDHHFFDWLGEVGGKYHQE